MEDTFFNGGLSQADLEIKKIIEKEEERQRSHLDLIASENLTSRAVMEAQGSVLTNKYAEGYPQQRYYGGCECVDEVETLALERVKALFGCAYANVQPHSGSQANQAVFLALLKPGDKILGMDLAAGGHLTHGHPMNLSGKWFDVCAYGVEADTGLVNYDAIEEIALREKPKLIIAGYSAYPRTLDFQRFRSIADQVGAYLMVDMAHFSGLVAAKLYPDPLPYADVVTSTTHKTLRGPRGGLILSNNQDLFKKLNSSVFPGIQGGPLMHVIAGKAVAFKLAGEESFKAYMQQVLKNAQALAQALKEKGINLVTGGTENHLLLLDLRTLGVTGADAEKVLERAGLIVNKNTIPFDPLPPRVTSGLRLGTPAVTTRGMKEAEMVKIADFVHHLLKELSDRKDIEAVPTNGVLDQIHTLCAQFPFYPTGAGA